MLVLPMRSPSSSPSRARDPSPYSVRKHKEESLQTIELRRQVANTMLAAMPAPTLSAATPPASKRPKLSLQTALPSFTPSPFLSAVSSSPTSWNTHRNALTLDDTPPTALSTLQPNIDFPSPQKVSTRGPKVYPKSPLNPLSCPPFSQPKPLPYNLPHDHHSILRNTPLSGRPQSTTLATPRSCKRMFQPEKRVAFSERAPEILPAPTIPESPSAAVTALNIPTTTTTATDRMETEEGPLTSIDATLAAAAEAEEAQARKDRQATIQEEDGHSTPGRPRSRKRQREWIWRPMPDEDDEEEEEDGITTASGVGVVGTPKVDFLPPSSLPTPSPSSAEEGPFEVSGEIQTRKFAENVCEHCDEGLEAWDLLPPEDERG